jgi:kynurenine formamidase
VQSPVDTPPRKRALELVDLSQEIFQGMSVYPGHLKTVIWEHASHAETALKFEGGFSFASQGLLMSDHGPTHVDAVSHLDPASDAPSIDEMPLSTFYGPGTCIDVSAAAPRTDIGPEDLDRAVASGGNLLQEGDALLMHTGSHARYGGTAEYSQLYPGLSAEAAEWILEKGVRVFGVDSPSPDNPASPTYPVHIMCRRVGLTHYENLASLDRVVGRRFTFIGLPLRIRGGTGSPVRAIAVLEDETHNGIA